METHSLISSDVNNMDIVAIIPARSGSKGLKNKNIASLGGKPLIAWSIEMALAHREISRVIVSTDCPYISDVARHYGAEVPFLRPANLAGDTSPLGEAVSHTLLKLQEMDIHFMGQLLMLPTHPFRTHHMMESALSTIRSSTAAFYTVRTCSFSPGCVVTQQGNYLRTISSFSTPLRSHRFQRFYGLLYAQRRFSGDRSQFIYEVSNPVHLIDIDSAVDLRLAETILDRGLYDA